MTAEERYTILRVIDYGKRYWIAQHAIGAVSRVYRDFQCACVTQHVWSCVRRWKARAAQ